MSTIYTLNTWSGLSCFNRVPRGLLKDISDKKFTPVQKIRPVLYKGSILYRGGMTKLANLEDLFCIEGV